MEHKNELNKDCLSKELIFILNILDKDRNHTIFKDDFESLDWDLFVKLSLHHRVFPLIYLGIQKINDIPSDTFVKLAYYYKRNTFYMLNLAAQMEFVSRKFADKDIPILFIKGPVLAQELYGDLALRPSSDIDVIIPKNDLQRTESFLLEEGFVKDEYIKSILGDWKWRHHHFTYIHPDKGIKLEVHWRLNPGPSKEPSFKELWLSRRKSVLFNQDIYYLGREELFIFLITHGARHGWSRLRWLNDIDYLIRQGFDNRSLNMLIRKYQLTRITGTTFILVNTLLNTPIQPHFEKYITSYSKELANNTLFYLKNMISLHNYPLPEEVEEYHSKYLYKVKSKRQKVMFLLSNLHPYPIDYDTLNLPQILHFLYFPLRPFLWIWRKKRNFIRKEESL